MTLPPAQAPTPLASPAARPSMGKVLPTRSRRMAPLAKPVRPEPRNDPALPSPGLAAALLGTYPVMALRYYGYLATRFPPRHLLSTATRRALRAAREKLARGPLAPGRAELLAGLGCETPAEVGRRISGAAALPRSDPAAIRQALVRHFPGEAERIAVRAEAAAAGRLSVFGKTVDVARRGGGTDWQLDPVHGVRFAGWAPSGSLPRPPGADPRMAWAVGRGEQWTALGCAAAADPDRADRHAEAFVISVRDFVSQNPVGRGVQWACPMEAALRAVCLAQAQALLAGRPALSERGFELDLAGLIVSTGRFVFAHLEDDLAVPNNHLAADWVGLLACGLAVPAWPESHRWRALAVAGLRREIASQTHAEGTSFEGSLPYHRLALEIFTAGGLLCRNARLTLGAAYWRRLASMYRAARGLLFADGTVAQIGDCDSGRVFAFHERRALEGGYLLPLGASVLADPGLRVDPELTGAEEVLWLCGPSALERLARVRPGPAPRTASFAQGGFHVLRRGRLEAAISCGRSGQRGIGGHSHNDKLAFELRAGGDLLVCDPGTYCYTSDPQLRNVLRGTRSHATVAIDGAEQSPITEERLFALPDFTTATLRLVESAERCERFVGEHRGYVRLGVVHRRELVLLDHGLVIGDHLIGSGYHAVELRFPLPSAEARLRHLRPGERAFAQDLFAAAWAREASLHGVAVEIGPENAPLALLAAASPSNLAVNLEPALYSPGYGELRRALAAVFTAFTACPATFGAVIWVPEERDSP